LKNERANGSSALSVSEGKAFADIQPRDGPGFDRSFEGPGHSQLATKFSCIGKTRKADSREKLPLTFLMRLYYNNFG